MTQEATASTTPPSMPAAFGGGAVIGALGGLIGLGGAEFRLPLLIGMFNFAALEAVILNKAMSLVVVATALPFRAQTVPFADVATLWPVILNLLAGSLLGAWFGAGWATRLKSETLYKVIALLLVVIAVALLFGHDATTGTALVTGTAQLAAGGLSREGADFAVLRINNLFRVDAARLSPQPIMKRPILVFFSKTPPARGAGGPVQLRASIPVRSAERGCQPCAGRRGRDRDAGG
jgi:hypothetical protein